MHANKKVVRVYDYVDSQVATLSRMFAKRVRGYRSLGYVIEEPVKTRKEESRLSIGI
jgi:hypothetical protein